MKFYDGILDDKRRLAAILTVSMLGGAAVAVVPLDYFWFSFIALTATLIIFCKYEIGFYLLVPLLLVELQKFEIKTGESLMTDYVGIYFPLFIIVFISWLLKRLSKLPGGIGSASPNVDLYVFLFIGWGAITLFWTPNFEHGLIQFIRFTGNVLLFYMAADAVFSETIQKRIVNILLVMGWVISIAAFISITLYRIHDYQIVRQIGDTILLKLTFFVYYILYHPRAMGILPHNATAAILNIIIGLVFVRFLYDKRFWYKSLLFISMIVMTIAVLHTKSRGAMIGYLSMWAFFIAGMPILRKNFFRHGIVFIAIFVAIYLSVYWEDIFSQRLSATAAEHSIKTRVGWWINGLNILSKKYMWVGIGVGGLKHYFNPLNIAHAHNLYLSFLLDFGIIGFASFIAFLAFIFKNLRKTMRHFKPSYKHMMLWGCSGSLIAVGIHCLIDAEYNIAVLWFLLGLTVASLRMAGLELKNEDAV